MPVKAQVCPRIAHSKIFMMKETKIREAMRVIQGFGMTIAEAGEKIKDEFKITSTAIKSLEKVKYEKPRSKYHK